MISIHAPARGATISVAGKQLGFQGFQSTLPRGERRLVMDSNTSTIKNFNPRSREGSDAIRLFLWRYQDIFQSTLPRGERPGMLTFLFISLIFQSTLPRGERRSYSAGRASDFYFNPRSREGSDTLQEFGSWLEGISIHAPARGATRHPRHRFLLPVYFNPRSREGSDADREQCGADYGDFNPRSREGSDGMSCAIRRA